MYQQMIFVNLATGNLDATKKFFGELGYAINPQFSDDTTVSIPLSEAIVVMFHTHEKYAEFTKKTIVDSTSSSEVLLALSAESRDKVDDLVNKAVAAGGAVTGEPQDHGFMYGRAFDDLDGHTWEVVWMDASAVEG
ncbi:Glyoxalase-like domain protein [Streptomyces sp. YIM 130001]|uniref:VOC family protein n=1 Tax=Streptomyces sp. YIM 130001 TaxID=2259644 RepID=UPI000E654AF7|nr:VOC family protein [Streptomyces sp. YIM 130001]RII20570.1 Glyoxalase-like domain protein [Streptomyces sp. YIM 130001]